MITPADIIISELVEDGMFITVITASVAVRAAVSLSEFAIKSSAFDRQEMRRMAAVNAGRKVWHHLYGDLVPELMKLDMIIQRDLYPSHDETEARKVFDKIFSMVRQPQ